MLKLDAEWVKVFKEKCELNHLQDLSTMPTVTVMAKWFMVDKLARISASNLVISLVIHALISNRITDCAVIRKAERSPLQFLVSSTKTLGKKVQRGYFKST